MKLNTLSQIKEVMVQAIHEAGFQVDVADLKLERTKQLAHGHFATNVAMMIAGKAKQNPRAVAEAILKKLDPKLFTKMEVAGPGFINVWIEQKFYSNVAVALLKSLDKMVQEVLPVGFSKGTMVIDYSHPNIAKPMGVHHLLSTILGDSIKKTYRKVGWTVVADNFIGDMGTQFGKLIHAIKTWGNMAEIEKDPIPNLLKLYVQFHIESDKDVELDDEARAEYRKFEDGDVESRKMWEKIVAWSKLEIQPIYDRLGVSFDQMNGESFYEDKMKPILDEGRKSGVIVDGKDGAWIVESNNPDEPPAVIRKADGATLYVTRDLARIKYWEKMWSPDLMVNVVDVAQEFHFKKLFEVAEKLKLTKAKNVHVGFGRMQFKDGSMSTRKGNIIMLSQLLDESEVRAQKLIEEKNVELDEAGKAELARVMGVGSVKYSILHQNRVSNITFDWDKMLSFEGNSAPYLMYTVARAKSIFRKAGLKAEECADFDLVLSDDKETKLMLDLMAYPEALERAARDFRPSHLANYLYELAQDFNAFYNDLPILQAEKELRNSRLLLTSATVKVMAEVFGLLGLEVPEKM
jgi:arginyl-tRNA synthetase